jgi:hypothetical protein
VPNLSNNYATPAWCIDLVRGEIECDANDTVVLEPSAGSAHIIRAFPRLRWAAVELDPAHTDVLTRQPNIISLSYATDYLGWCPPHYHRCCVMNPPYHLSLEFVRKARNEADYIWAFLKLSWLESESRHAFLTHNPPADIFVIPQRVSSTGDGKSDNAPRAWYRWGPRPEGPTRLHLLPLVPKELRR